mmetsp:Transcript_23514/g.38625  ORF Transcript_23514/g.38625 Transcript_23514/m.38625 type:complete len:111 (-) Transcript_23514:253-585(-)
MICCIYLYPLVLDFIFPSTKFTNSIYTIFILESLEEVKKELPPAITIMIMNLLLREVDGEVQHQVPPGAAPQGGQAAAPQPQRLAWKSKSFFLSLEILPIEMWDILGKSM